MQIIIFELEITLMMLYSFINDFYRLMMLYSLINGFYRISLAFFVVVALIIIVSSTANSP